MGVKAKHSNTDQQTKREEEEEREGGLREGREG